MPLAYHDILILVKQKTLIFIAVLVVLAAGGALYFLSAPKKQASSPYSPEIIKEAKPSETFIEYTDPSGFTFNYPDNLSIEKSEEMDSSTYADLQLFSKDVSGSLALRINDTKLKSVDDWAKETAPQGAPIEKKLGTLKALEVKTGDRMMLGAIDQGVLFSIEVPLIEQDFWMQVYNKLLTDFTFAVPETTSTAGGVSYDSEEVIFESEEVVE